jgi:hypothetical protein
MPFPLKTEQKTNNPWTDACFQLWGQACFVSKFIVIHRKKWKRRMAAMLLAHVIVRLSCRTLVLFPCSQLEHEARSKSAIMDLSDRSTIPLHPSLGKYHASAHFPSHGYWWWSIGGPVDMLSAHFPSHGLKFQATGKSCLGLVDHLKKKLLLYNRAFREPN